MTCVVFFSGSPYCPVASYERYMMKLNPYNDKLWQKPLDSITEDQPTWYCNSGLGDKTLKTFMSKLSDKCKLSQPYTNHSIRATGATILSKHMYGAAQIMAVTGHKSVQSLTTYQRVDTEEKIKMGQTLSTNVCPSKHQLALPSSEKLAIMAPPTNEGKLMERNSNIMTNLPPGTVVQDLVPVNTQTVNVSSAVDHLKDVNLDQLLNDFNGNDQNNTCNTQSTSATYMRPQIFYGPVTVVHNLTINKS